MTTKRRRGRDPEQHVVHETPSAANTFTGIHGEISLVSAGGAESAEISQIRVHNGLQVGGFIVPVSGPAGEAKSSLPAAAVFPAAELTLTDATAFTVTHNLGYYPLVQIVEKVGGAVVPITSIDHTSETEVAITPATLTGGSAVCYVLLR